MKNKERAIGLSLILHLLLSLVMGTVISVTEKLTQNEGFINTLTVALTALRYAIPIFLYCKMTGFIPFVSSLNSPKVLKNSVLAKKKNFLFIFGLVLLVTVLNAVGTLTDALLSVFGQTSGFVTSSTQNNILFSFVKTVCLAALVEEILFRGAFLHAFSDRSDGERIALSALTFALMHGNIRQFFYALAAGLVIATFTVMTDSLSFAVLLHLSTNFMTFIFSVLKEHFDAKTYTRVALITLLVFFVAAVLCTVWYFFKIRIKRKAPVAAEGGRYPIELMVYLLAAATVTVIGLF